MSPANKEFLENNYHHWVTLRDAQYLRGLNSHEREGMQRVMAEEFIKGYTCDLWCPSCCATMVALLYRLYDEWKAKQVVPETLPEPVKANFPKHNKKHHRK